jgi:uncharacterized protein (DUF1810 family)
VVHFPADQRPRLKSGGGEIRHLLAAVLDRSIGDILGYPDDVKFRSSMTLFAKVAADAKDFIDALDKFYGSEFDALTVERL